MLVGGGVGAVSLDESITVTMASVETEATDLPILPDNFVCDCFGGAFDSFFVAFVVVVVVVVLDHVIIARGGHYSFRANNLIK